MVTAPLRLLLFGLPGSGKTSLLGSLAQASASQEAVLKGKVADDTGKLDLLRKGAYSGSLPSDDAEAAAYAVSFQPQGGEPALTTTLLDGSGALAQQYLAGRRPLTPRDSRLARAMLEADTVIVTVDAAMAGQVEGGLPALGKFLTQLQEVRARRVDVAGLPVYLVLTKCDELAKPGDTFSKWQQRMEEAKRKLGERFASYLDRHVKAGPFGTIDLQVWATAIGRPVLADRPEASPEPYGVAELFRQAFASAATFDRREHQAGRRLELAVGGLGFLVLMLGLVGSLFALTQPDTERIDLEARVQTVLPEKNGKPDARLRGDIPGRLNVIRTIQKDPAFDKLPAKTRNEVDHAADELTSYLEARERFQAVVKQPFLAKNEAEFMQFEKEAQAFALPQAYAVAWDKTPLARRLANVLREYTAVHTALDERVAWIRRQVNEGRKLDDRADSEILPKLRKLDKKDREQLAKPWFDAFTDYRRQPSFNRPADEPIPGVTGMVWADLDKFEAVRHARKDWDKVRRDLDETYDRIAKRLAE